jgi:hypothetical protein
MSSSRASPEPEGPTSPDLSAMPDFSTLLDPDFDLSTPTNVGSDQSVPLSLHPTFLSLSGNYSESLGAYRNDYLPQGESADISGIAMLPLHP